MSHNEQTSNLPLVSIIVPVYNTAPYLEMCVESLLVQTHKNLQVIMVNDGSTDHSKALCLALCALDNRCQYVEQANGGLSAARNTGLQWAKGEYLSFVDSDDYVAPTFIERLLKACTSTGCLVSSCGRVVVYESRQEVMFSYDTEQIWEGAGLLNRFLNWDGLDGSVCDKLFHHSMLPLLHFSPGRISEDLPITAAILLKAKRLVHVGAAMYHYVQRGNSITNHGFSPAKLSVLESTTEVRQMVIQAYPGLVKQAAAYHWRHVMLLRDMLIGQEAVHPLACQRLNEEMKKDFGAFLWSPFFGMKQKLKAFILIHMSFLYLVRKRARFTRIITSHDSMVAPNHP